MKTKLTSPSRSQGAHTPKRKSRRTLSVGSPALSTASGRLSSVVQGFVNKQMNSFALSPLPKRRSVLTDNTDIMEEPRRKSWWKNLNENSRNVFEILDHNNVAGSEPNNIMEELDMEILSQEKKNYTLDIPESSDGESIHSIILPQRKLFNQKESQHQKFGQIIGNRESMTKSNKNITINDKVVNAGTKELFQNKPRSKLLFPPALLDISPDKTIADKTIEFAAEPKTQPRNIFGNRQGSKRKNMFADFIATESEDEIPEIQPRVFGFPKKPELIRRGSSASRGVRQSSPMSNVTTDTEMDEWRMLPSSTMVEHQLEAMMEQNTSKRLRLSKLTETKESSGTSSVSSKTKSPEVNTSVLTRSRSRALNNSGASTIGGKNKTQEKLEPNQSKKNNRHDQRQINKSNKLKENDIDSDQNDDRNLSIANISQGKINKSREKHNKSLQKTNVSLKVTDAIENQSQEVVDGNEKVNVALEANQTQDQTDKKQEQQNKVNVKLENSTPKFIAKSQEVEESKKSIINDENKEVEETEQEDEDHEEESENEKNDSQEATEESDKEELDKSQDQINESQEQDNETEEQANESQAHYNESDEQEEENQAAEQIRVEVNDSNEVINQSQFGENDEKNDEDIDQTGDKVNESNEAADESDEISQEEDNVNEEVDESNQAPDASNEIADKSQEDKVEKEVDESKQAADESGEIADQSQVEDREGEEIDEINQAADESNEIADQSQVEGKEEEEVDESNQAADESNEVQNESQLAIEDDENEANDENTQEDDDDENGVQNESQLAVKDENEATEDDNTQEEVDESSVEDDDENEAVEDESAELYYESASEEMEVDDEPQNNEDDTPIDEENNSNTPEPADNEYNISHDTTGRNRNKHTSPEAILHDKSKQSDSFSARRNTSIRKTKSVVNLLNDKPSLMLARDSVGFSDGTTNSSAEGSGWDSHRTTRKTIRQTFGRDATPRKSLRALVMEKSAKRHTLASETAKFPLANSTAVPEISLGYLDIQPVHQESTHEVSLRTRQLTLDAVLEKIKEDNLIKKAAIEESVKKSLESRSDNHIFKVPLRPLFPRRQTNKENKPSKLKPIWRGLPEEMIEDLQYRPPKRFKPSNAPWINKRLYKYLENKLEPKFIMAWNGENTPPQDFLVELYGEEEDDVELDGVALYDDDDDDEVHRSTSPSPAPTPSPVPSPSPAHSPSPTPPPFSPLTSPVRRDRSPLWANRRSDPYDYKARVRAEKLVETLYNFTKDLRRQTAATEDATNVLKHEMARLQIVRTHHEYYEFFRQFMPKEIRIKVIPDVVNKIPLPRRDVFSDIIASESAQG